MPTYHVGRISCDTVKEGKERRKRFEKTRQALGVLVENSGSRGLITPDDARGRRAQHFHVRQCGVNVSAVERMWEPDLVDVLQRRARRVAPRAADPEPVVTRENRT